MAVVKRLCLDLILLLVISYQNVAMADNGNYVLIKSPASSHNGQGSTVTYPLHYNIDLKWGATLSPLTCDVWQTDDDGHMVVERVFTALDNTTMPYTWNTHNLGNVSNFSPLFFHLYWDTDPWCPNCDSNSTTFTLHSKHHESGGALRLGLGVGLGLGIPLILIGILTTWWCMRRKHRRDIAKQGTLPTNEVGGSMVSPILEPESPNTSRSPVSAAVSGNPNSSALGEQLGTFTALSSDLSSGETSRSEARTPVAEIDSQDVVELCQTTQLVEADIPPPRAELEGETIPASARTEKSRPFSFTYTPTSAVLRV